MQPLYFRPPYDIDEEPDTDDEAAPVVAHPAEGYIIIGSKIDTDDWNEHPRKTPPTLSSPSSPNSHTMKTKPQFRGSIILMHDGGGDRSATVAALGPLIDALRARGYTIVPVSALMGKTTAAGHAAAHLLAARAHHSRLHRLLRARYHRQLHRHGLLRRRHSHERAAHPRRPLRHH